MIVDRTLLEDDLDWTLLEVNRTLLEEDTVDG